MTSEQLDLGHLRVWHSRTVLPTDNQLGIPCLDPAMQADCVKLPMLLWGERKGVINTGTWAFYVDDSAYRRARHDPKVLANSKCYAATEMNFSIFEDTPPAVAVSLTYEKRFMAARWQHHGIRVFVDLLIPDNLRSVCMLGVPPGWRAFSTRGFADRLDELESDYEFASTWAGRQPLLLVVGGGKPAQQLCRELPGTIWFPGYSPREQKTAAPGGETKQDYVARKAAEQAELNGK